MEQMLEKSYICIDLKSFYASVECADRGLDPLDANLVVADETRTEKTICLAVSPSLKALGISGRARLFEVVQRVAEVNAQRAMKARVKSLESSSHFARELEADPKLAVSYIVARPRMARYMEVSAQIYDIYLRYISAEDIHVYSVDEVFIDVTCYLKTYRMTPRQLAMRMISDVLRETGITATVGIGTNMYLAKIAMDIDAKHMKPDQNGVRISELDEMSYRRRLWSHTPITDFWRIGGGIAKRLEQYGIRTMGDIALCSVADERSALNESFLYKLFGINAELVIDHAWGWEPCTIADVKAYRPQTHSLSTGQVLSEPYEFEKAELIVREMADNLAMDLFSKGLVCDQIVLNVAYDIENISDPERRRRYKGEIASDHYGRRAPKPAHGSANLKRQTASTKLITETAVELFRRIADRSLLVRRINIAANHAVPEGEVKKGPVYEQTDLFTDPEESLKQFLAEDLELEKERSRQAAIVEIRSKFGKNAILKGMNYEEGATARERNAQIGGHRAGAGEKAGEASGESSSEAENLKKNAADGTTNTEGGGEDMWMRHDDAAYESIIDMPHHRSKERPHMSLYDRAAQFAPFAALVGYGDTVAETARRTEKRPLLDDSETELIDRRLRDIRARISERPEATLSYFVPDRSKEGGAVVTVSGRVAAIDAQARVLVFEDGSCVNIEDIVEA